MAGSPPNRATASGKSDPTSVPAMQISATLRAMVYDRPASDAEPRSTLGREQPRPGQAHDADGRPKSQPDHDFSTHHTHTNRMH